MVFYDLTGSSMADAQAAATDEAKMRLRMATIDLSDGIEEMTDRKNVVMIDSDDEDLELIMEIKVDEDDKPLALKRERAHSTPPPNIITRRKKVPKHTIPCIIPSAHVSADGKKLTFEFDLGEEAAMLLDEIGFDMLDDEGRKWQVSFRDQRNHLLADGRLELPGEFVDAGSPRDEHIKDGVRIIYEKR